MTSEMATPSLRFSISDNSNWQPGTLSDVVSVTMGQSPDSSSYNEVKRGLPLIQGNADIKRGRSSPSRYTDSPTKTCKVGDILLSVRAPVGEVAKSEHDACIGRGIAALRGLDSDTDFWFYYLERSKARLEQFAQGSTFTAINSKDIAALRVAFPGHNEKKKIAEFLTVVDTKIDLIRQQNDLLETYKKGLMQKLFSQEIRFKADDGSEFPDWTCFSLREAGHTYGGLGNKNSSHFGHGSNYITFKQVYDQKPITLQGAGLVYVGPSEKQTKVLKGDILVTGSSETPSDVGRCSVLLDDFQNTYLNSFCFGYRPTMFGRLLPEFAGILFQSPEYRTAVQKLAQGSTRYNISKSGFLSISLRMPSIGEQRKIFDFLNAITERLDATEDQLDKLLTFKSGLLQQMFV